MQISSIHSLCLLMIDEGSHLANIDTAPGRRERQAEDCLVFLTCTHVVIQDDSTPHHSAMPLYIHPHHWTMNWYSFIDSHPIGTHERSKKKKKKEEKWLGDQDQLDQFTV